MLVGPRGTKDIQEVLGSNAYKPYQSGKYIDCLFVDVFVYLYVCEYVCFKLHIIIQFLIP